MSAVLFDPLGMDLFQLLVFVLVAAAIGFVVGAAWAGDRRDEIAVRFAGRDIQDEARRGLIERRRYPRAPHVRHTTAPRIAPREPNREWMR